MTRLSIFPKRVPALESLEPRLLLAGPVSPGLFESLGQGGVAVAAAAVVKPVLTITSQDDNTAAETDPGQPPDTAVFTIVRTATTGDLAVNFTRGGTATAGATGDYILRSDGADLKGTSVVIKDGQDHVDITVVPLHNPAAERTETVILTLRGSTKYSLDPVKANGTATVSILDSEPIVSVQAIDNQAAETAAGKDTNTGIFRISRDTTKGKLTVNFTRTGTALFGPTRDYTLKVNGQNATTASVVIPDGQAYVDVAVTPVDNLLAEPTETVTLRLATNTAYHLDPMAANRTATVSILDLRRISINAVAVKTNGPLVMLGQSVLRPLDCAYNMIIGGSLSGGLIKTGPGTLVLSDANLFTGRILFEGGNLVTFGTYTDDNATLRIDGSATLLLDLRTNATLRIYGSIPWLLNLQTNATIWFGGSTPGLLNVLTNATLESSAPVLLNLLTNGTLRIDGSARVLLNTFKTGSCTPTATFFDSQAGTGHLSVTFTGPNTARYVLTDDYGGGVQTGTMTFS